MSGPTGAGAGPPTAVLGLGLDPSGLWQQRATQPSRAVVQTAGGGRGTRTPLRLPSLVAKGPRQRSSSSMMARLSLSEPSLLTLHETVLFQGFSSTRHPSVLQKRPPPPSPSPESPVPLPFKTCQSSRTRQPHAVQNSSRATFIHFSRAVQPSSKPGPARRHSHNPGLSTVEAQRDLPPVAAAFQGALLSVVGKPCLLSCSQRPAAAAAAGPARTQLHVFLPTEAEGEEADSESVDEGFMDELDCKITSLKLRQGAPKTVSYP